MCTRLNMTGKKTTEMEMEKNIHVFYSSSNTVILGGGGWGWSVVFVVFL